jgi:large subunit ribosomal protein L21
VRVFKYRPKKGYRRRAGHRSELTRLEITDVKMLTRKPAASGSAKKEPAGQKKPAAKKEASSGS